MRCLAMPKESGRAMLTFMKVLFTRFPLESIYGGAEVQTLSLMKGLRERGHEVGFLGSCPVLLGKLQELGIKNKELGIGNPPVTKWGVVSFLWRQRAMRKKLLNALQASHPSPLPPGEGNVICMLSLTEKLLLTEWAVAQNIRVFWIEHDRIGRWLRWNPRLSKLRRLSKLATTVAVSDLSKRIYVNELGWDPERIAVIPNGIDVERFRPRDGSSPLTMTRGFHIGCIARLSEEKGVDLLIEAIKDLPNIHLTIVGTGRDERKIQNLIRLHLQQRAHSTGSRSGPEPSGPRAGQVTIQYAVDDVAAFYRSLDIFILPSRDHDPCPLAPIEAMACGVPVIMTNACGTAGYLEHGKDALIVPSNSIGALKEAIAQLQSDDDLRRRLAERGPRVVAERFSIGRMVDQYENLLA